MHMFTLQLKDVPKLGGPSSLFYSGLPSLGPPGATVPPSLRTPFPPTSSAVAASNAPKVIFVYHYHFLSHFHPRCISLPVKLTSLPTENWKVECDACSNRLGNLQPPTEAERRFEDGDNLIIDAVVIVSNTDRKTDHFNPVGV